MFGYDVFPDYKSQICTMRPYTSQMLKTTPPFFPAFLAATAVGNLVIYIGRERERDMDVVFLAPPQAKGVSHAPIPTPLARG